MKKALKVLAMLYVVWIGLGNLTTPLANIMTLVGCGGGGGEGPIVVVSPTDLHLRTGAAGTSQTNGVLPVATLTKVNGV